MTRRGGVRNAAGLLAGTIVLLRWAGEDRSTSPFADAKGDGDAQSLCQQTECSNRDDSSVPFWYSNETRACRILSRPGHRGRA